MKACLLRAPAAVETNPLEFTDVPAPRPAAGEVLVRINYCGVCRTDLHVVEGELARRKSPVIPGPQVVGTVEGSGEGASRFQRGARVGIAWLHHTDGTCRYCRSGAENLCDDPSFTGWTVDGGYAEWIVAPESFVYPIPDAFRDEQAAPLLCAGITTYAPLRRYVTPGRKIAVVGLGGLGHMGVKIGKAMGAHVTVLSHSPGKRDDALRLGADAFIATGDEGVFEKYAKRFDFILDTVSARHDYNDYLGLLRRDGTMVLVGVAEPTLLSAAPLIMQRRTLGGSLIGGIRETQEMLDFCAKHDVAADVEVIPIQKVNEAYERMLRNDVRYRFVIDIASLKQG